MRSGKAGNKLVSKKPGGKSSGLILSLGRLRVKSITRYLRWMMMLFAIGLATGCAVKTGGSYCDLTKPIWWESSAELDATPDGIVRQVVAHNETWQAVCQ